MNKTAEIRFYLLILKSIDIRLFIYKFQSIIKALITTLLKREQLSIMVIVNSKSIWFI